MATSRARYWISAPWPRFLPHLFSTYCVQFFHQNIAAFIYTDKENESLLIFELAIGMAAKDCWLLLTFTDCCSLLLTTTDKPSSTYQCSGSVTVTESLKKWLLKKQAYLKMTKRRKQNSDFPVGAADTDARVELIWSFGGLNEIKGFDGIFHKLDAHRGSFSSIP